MLFTSWWRTPSSRFFAPTFRQEHQNRLSADSMLDLVVSGRHAANTTAENCADTVVSGRREEGVEGLDGES